VGGTIAGRVADTLADLAEERQVICITHLAAIASRASVHLAVRKSTEGERTVTTLEPVEGEDRVEEIARMLGGADRAESARTHARELLTKEPK
jgi:DNA repair protein RecN (Recombination protein N)